MCAVLGAPSRQRPSAYALLAELRQRCQRRVIQRLHRARRGAIPINDLAGEEVAIAKIVGPEKSIPSHQGSPSFDNRARQRLSLRPS
jgi:hypothetical protein